MAAEEIPAVNLQHAFSIRFQLGRSVRFEGEMRSRNFEPVTGGEISGPRLQGRVVPQSGAEYASNNLMDTRLMLQADDGTWLYMQQYGYELEDREGESGTPYFRVSPYFDTPPGPHAWLAKTVLLGTGERRQDPAELVIHYYEVL